ncbi:MAG: DUF3298 and DUF4163 domain-containing protein [Bacillus sp. (in: Bacteria)]|nr:DUF3298 and DUF4163 domain-containing protein [Bacillus sp. (in: firmicutes)]MCM1425575.1 DUF3298 and DUF4163 domain-containing protein [Eubacterium sp.]
MKQKIIFRLSMIVVCVCAVCLCLYMTCTKQDKMSFSPYQPESIFSVMPSTVQGNKIFDIAGILNGQNADSMQDSDIIQYTAHTTLTSPVSIFMYSEKRSTEAVNDRTIIYESTCTYPHVIIDGNENAAAKINADIQTMVDSFYTDTPYPAWSKDEYEEYYNTNVYIYNSDKLLFSVARADSNVISFHITDECYTGGAHGMDYHTGVNYDTRTGEKIDFADLCADADAFHQNTLTFLQNLAAFNSYQSIMWSDESWAGSIDLENTLYQDNRWYLSTSGLVFFSNPYELGAFYAGEIEFTIPYADLEEMDFQEQYAYDGKKTICLQTEKVCSYDLNGDGQDEEIQFYIEQPGSAGTNLHFIINGVDYALQNEQLAGQFSDDAYIFCWTECFLYDMDTEDDAIEIAFQMNWENPGGDGVIPTTFFYRYEKDASLTYLGKAQTTVTDSSVVFDFTPEYDTLMESKVIYAG